jgi:hypothetical protein
VTSPREPAPLAPPEDEPPEHDSGPIAVIVDALPPDPEATPLPPAIPYHVADPTSWSMERRLRPDTGEPPAVDDDTTIPEHLRGSRFAVAPVDAEDLATSPHTALSPTEPTDPGAEEPTAEDTEGEATRPHVRFGEKQR